MKFSWNQCTQFAQIAQGYVERSKGGETKLTYAINRVITRIQKEQAKITDALADIDINFCVTGENDVIVRDAQGNLQYTKDNMKLRNAAKTKHLSSENVEIEPYHARKLPDDLSVFEVEAFAGFVIDPEEVEGLMQAIEARGDAVAESKDDHHDQAAGASA